MDKITRKTLLYKSGVEYADYGLNHVEGCSHGCTYPCYAMMMKKRCGVVKTYDAWVKPKIVGNALELLDNEIPRLKSKIQTVFLCFSTDPFMYKQNEVSDLTLKILERLNIDDIKATLISKGSYPLELSDKVKYNTSNEYGSTIITIDEGFRRKYEPGAAPIKERIESLRKLHDAGLKTWVSMEPYPTPNMVEQNLQEILSGISFVDKIVFGKWNYNKKTSEYLEYKDFYNSMAHQVISFCEENGIDVHIKEGTISSDHLVDSRSAEKTTLETYGKNKIQSFAISTE